MIIPILDVMSKLSHEDRSKKKMKKKKTLLYVNKFFCYFIKKIKIKKIIYIIKHEKIINNNK